MWFIRYAQVAVVHQGRLCTDPDNAEFAGINGYGIDCNRKNKIVKQPLFTSRFICKNNSNLALDTRKDRGNTTKWL